MADEKIAGAGLRRSDGAQTHVDILDAAMKLASVEGLGSVSFGRLAQELQISKSGVFAHFRSKEQLQAATIEAARHVFEREVLRPGLAAAEGLAQLEGICEAYLSYIERGVFPGGCFFAQLLGEFDALEGPVHQEVLTDQRSWLGLLEELATKARQMGEIERSTDAGQLAFELYAPLELANYLTVLNRDSSVIARARQAVRATLAGVAHDKRKGADS